MTDADGELELRTRSGRFGALAWRQPAAPPALCLHGWLDNAASFQPLARQLTGLDLVALDFAGHGHSQHRPAGARYYFMDNLFDVDAVLDALEWAECDLIGHSMGGAVACVFAAISPERVRRLVLLDGLGPTSAPPDSTVTRLRKSRESVRKATGRLREFPDLAAAVAARRSASDLSEAAAAVLCERSLEPYEDHFRWRSDPRLNWHSPTLLMESQVLDILAAIECPTLNITARPLARWIDPVAAGRRLDSVRDCRHHWIEGRHHFHMEAPEQVAPLILDFLLRPETRDHVPSKT